MEFNTNKSLFLGINKEGDLINLELNFNDLNKGTKFYNPHYYISPHGYTDIKDEETGEKEARERLEDSDYWDELGLIDQKSFLKDFINFKDVADHVINTDGWTMTNGEYFYLGNYKDLEYYISLNWIGKEDKILFQKRVYQKLYISEEDLIFLSKCGEVKEANKEEVRKLKTIFSKYQDTKEIIKDFLAIN